MTACQIIYYNLGFKWVMQIKECKSKENANQAIQIHIK